VNYISKYFNYYYDWKVYFIEQINLSNWYGFDLLAFENASFSFTIFSPLDLWSPYEDSPGNYKSLGEYVRAHTEYCTRNEVVVGVTATITFEEGTTFTDTFYIFGP
jgi:hypothetical protein